MTPDATRRSGKLVDEPGQLQHAPGGPMKGTFPSLTIGLTGSHLSARQLAGVGVQSTQVSGDNAV